MRLAHWRREFEFAKWWPKKIGQSRIESRPDDLFSFKHWASYIAMMVTAINIPVKISFGAES
jgi:hypothetical protein